jgi:hypothetical protein
MLFHEFFYYILDWHINSRIILDRINSRILYYVHTSGKNKKKKEKLPSRSIFKTLSLGF